MKHTLTLFLLIALFSSCQQKEKFIGVYAMNVKSLMASGALGKSGSIETYFVAGLHEKKDWISQSYDEYENRRVKIGWFILELPVNKDSYSNIAYRMLDTLGKINFWEHADTSRFNWKGNPEAKEEYKATMNALNNGFYWRFENVQYFIEESTLETQISRKGYLIYNTNN